MGSSRKSWLNRCVYVGFSEKGLLRVSVAHPEMAGKDQGRVDRVEKRKQAGGSRRLTCCTFLASKVFLSKEGRQRKLNRGSAKRSGLRSNLRDAPTSASVPHSNRACPASDPGLRQCGTGLSR